MVTLTQSSLPSSGWNLIAVSAILAVSLSYLAPVIDGLQRKLAAMFAGEFPSTTRLTVP